MPANKITSRAVDALTSSGKDLFLWDGELAGFGVRVTPAGAKSYIYQYRMGGRGSVSRRYTIGRHRSPWTAQSARAKASRLARQVGKGKDPVARRRDRRRREVELRFDHYVEYFTHHYLEGRWKDWERIHRMLLAYAVPVIGSKKLSDIRRGDLAEIYRRLDNLPSVARAMHATFRKMFKWATSQDDLKSSPVDGVEAPAPLRARDRYLSTGELQAAWSTSSALPHPFGPMLRMMMLTGQRRGEVVGLNWSELERTRAKWTLPAQRTKNGHLHVIPLSRQAIALLDGMAVGSSWPQSGLVFPSTRGTPLSAFSKVKRQWDGEIVKALRRSDNGNSLTPWRLHDIRRTVATGMQALSVRTEVIESVLNHRSGVKSGIVGVYQCYDYLEERGHALKAWGRYVVQLCKP